MVAPHARSAPPRPAADPATVVHALVGDLISAYQRLGPAVPPAVPSAGPLVSLSLAEAVLRLGRAESHVTARPRQIAVIGPTQVGKSTIVNLLLGRPVAQVSPLAAFTVHPQGFWVTHHPEPHNWLEPLFPGWRRCAPADLQRTELTAYAVTPVEPAELARAGDDRASAGLPPCVVWDTPDFDSLSAAAYQAGVLETAALADLYLLVVSKEKYSDLSVWNMLRLLEPLGRPLIIALNKITPEAAGPVMRSLRERLAEFGRNWGDVPILTVEYAAQLTLSDGPEFPLELAERYVGPLRGLVRDRLPRGRACPDPGGRALVRRHWDEWLAPLRAENAVSADWHRRIDRHLQAFLERYRRDYVDHPQRYDAFRRAAVELLHLLEIPKLSGWIGRARQVVTWPVRQLWASARAARSARKAAGASAARHYSAEAAVLFDALDELLANLQYEGLARQDAGAPAAAAAERALARRLRADEPALRERFQAALEAHHVEITREVQAAASRLYEELQRQPVRLAALRAARAGVDVGALVLALKTGGITPVDLVWAPATFALSSLLVEGFAGAQMAGVARGLKKRQLEAVEQTLVQRALAPALHERVDLVEDPALFGIPAERLDAATTALRAWEQEGHD